MITIVIADTCLTLGEIILSTTLEFEKKDSEFFHISKDPSMAKTSIGYLKEYQFSRGWTRVNFKEEGAQGFRGHRPMVRYKNKVSGKLGLPGVFQGKET